MEKTVAWIILVLSGMLEAVWATALGKSESFTKLWPTVIFGIALVLSMGGLAWAMRDIPVGTAYAVWVGIGAALTVVWAMVFGGEPASLLKVLLIVALVGCVIGLKLVDDAH
ncbi:quaternary ammonium compound-resistance protein SugE [Frigoribacterium sp. CG_9.8]|jgi:quaternary ammonium compound-resistance protein SugE|nr:multidrug efflux SMR transporter [Frigoribacterium sp. CG_9.8]MBG6106851.1 quaternary ammonium compound-resistance protein SugE [Frigoribacterium sp. CG_9.8]